MQSVLGSNHQKCQSPGPSAPCAPWPVDLKLTHLDWNPEASLIHFQGKYLTICESDYSILQVEIQSIPKTKAAVDVGDFCLVEDSASACWYRGRVQKQKEDLFDVFLIDHGNVLSVDVSNMSSCSNDLFILPPKIVCGFLANVLLLQGCSHSVEDYFSSLIGKDATGYIQALLPHKVLLLEAPDINMDLVRHGFGRHVDTDTFLLLVEMLTEAPLKQNIAPVPDLLIEKPKGQEFWFKPTLQGYEDILSFCGPILGCGTRVKVRVTAALNLGLFYCQLASMETSLWEMSKKLAAVCEHRTRQHGEKSPENLGLLCSVKGKDGKWHRGLIAHLPADSRVRVLFVDYGFFESVEVEDVHRLPPDFLSTPIMAFPCSLFSQSDQNEDIKHRQLSFLKAGLLGNLLDVEIRSFDKEQHLYSITVIGIDDTVVKKPKPVQKPLGIKAEPVSEAEQSLQGGCLYHETVMCEAFGKTLEVEEVREGSVFVGYVEHVQNPNQFWIRTQKRNDKFEDMMTEMAAHFSQVKLDEDVLLNPELGTLCCAVYEEDMHFYRGVVTDILDHGAEVLFIDFGNIEKVPHMLIKKTPKAFARESAFAFCCSLVNVLPVEDVWTSSACDSFRRAVSDKALLVHVVQRRKNKLVVDLHELGSDNKQSVTEFLVSLKEAEYWNNIPFNPVVQNNTGATDKTSCPSLTSDINGNAHEEKACRSETEKPESPANFKPLSIKPGFEFLVRCSVVNSPSDFWCQPLDKGSALEELMEKIQLSYSKHTRPLPPGESCCVAKSPLDGLWYRAFITERRENCISVLLVDYGYTIQIKEQSLQAIMPEYVQLEGVAFRCSLFNLIEPADPKNCKTWSPEACKSLKDFVHETTHGLKCQVVSQFNVKNKGLYNAVDLYNTRTQQSFRNLLLKQGLARETTLSSKQLSAVLPESYVFSSYDLIPGSEEQVFVTYVSSQWEVFCHLERNFELIDELERKISEEIEEIMQASTKDVVTKLCLAKYLDGKWYRGLVHPVQSPLHARVFFVDFGNTNISEKTHVMSIPRGSADLLYTPMQALRCNLVSVPKEDLYADVKKWLDDAVLNKQVRAIILDKNRDGSFDVELFDGDVNINDKVRELILSLTPKPKMDSVGTKKSNRGTPVNGQQGWHSSKFPTSSAYSRPHVSNTHLKKTESKKMYALRKAQSKNTKGKRQIEHTTRRCLPVKPLKNSQAKQQAKCREEPQKTEDTKIPQLLCSPNMKVSEGFRAKCFVSHVDSVDSFFVQLSCDETTILKMAEDLNSLRDSLESTPSLSINDFVLAEYEEDGGLYRSVVKDDVGGSRFKVEFVDYGNSGVMGKEKIYFLPKDYVSQPRCSIPCSLLDPSSYKNHTSFSDAVMEKPLMVDFVCQCGGRWKVNIEIVDEADVDLPESTVEAAVESSTATEKEEEAPTNSSQVEEEVPSCEQNYLGKEIGPNETPVTPSPKLKVTCRQQGRTHPRNQGDSEENQDQLPIIQAKDTKDCRILSVLSNGSFYVRLDETSKLVPALESHIVDSLCKCELVVEEDVEPGLKCLVQVHKEKQWRRAVVQHVCRDKCQVLLTDQGTTVETQSCSIRRQCADLTKIPDLAVLCKVNSFGFGEGDGAHRRWCDVLKPMIGQEVKIMFVCYSEADRLWKVEIILNGLFLVDRRSPSHEQREETIISPAKTQSQKTERKSNLDTRQPQHLLFAPIDLDKIYSGFAAAVTTPFEFCVVLEDLLLVMNEVSMMLDDLPEQMPPLPESHLLPGTCCLLKSDAKNKWCRAEIVHVGTTAVLNLVDYGHCESMSYEHCSQLRRLPGEMTSLPKMTYPCMLRGVKPPRVDEQWSDEAAVFFQQYLYQKNIQIFFREFVSNTHWKVDILVDGVHVAKELVDAGHASYMDVMLGLRFQEQVPCETAPHRPDSDEEPVREDEGSQGKSDPSVESTDEAARKMPASILPASKLCPLM